MRGEGKAPPAGLSSEHNIGLYRKSKIFGQNFAMLSFEPAIPEGTGSLLNITKLSNQ